MFEGCAAGAECLKEARMSLARRLSVLLSEMHSVKEVRDHCDHGWASHPR